MRHLLFLAFSLAVTPVVAQGFTDPRALLGALYATYKSDAISGDPLTTFGSARLNTLYEKDAEEANGEVGRIDFDPFVNGQDYEISKLEIGEAYYAAGKATVRVTFSNFDTSTELGFLLVQEDGGWKIDDVWHGGDEFAYDLLDILQAPLN